MSGTAGLESPAGLADSAAQACSASPAAPASLAIEASPACLASIVGMAGPTESAVAQLDLVSFVGALVSLGGALVTH